MGRNRFCRARNRPMTPTSMQASRQRDERSIPVPLPMQVTGRDSRGVVFTEETSSENLCRGGAAFVTRFDLAVGSDLDIRIPLSQPAWKREDNTFATRGRIVHVSPATGPGERLVGVQFTGPRFQRVF